MGRAVFGQKSHIALFYLSDITYRGNQQIINAESQLTITEFDVVGLEEAAQLKYHLSIFSIHQQYSRLKVGVEQKPRPKLRAKTQNWFLLDWDTRNTGIPATIFMQKAERIYSSCTFIKKVKGRKSRRKKNSYCFLPESCSRCAGIYCILIEQNQFWVLLKVSVLVSAQPLCLDQAVC